MDEFERLAWRRAFSTLESARVFAREGNAAQYSTRNTRRSELARRLLDWCFADIQHERSSRDGEDPEPLIDWGRECCVIDFETTGLDPRECDITEVAVIRTDRHLRPIRELHLLVTPARPWLGAGNAWIKKNTRWGREGCDVDRWKELGAVSLGEAIKQIEPFLVDASPIAHFMPFETKWLRAALAVRSSTVAGQVHSGKWLRGAICTRDLSSIIKARGITPSRSLADVTKALGVAHTPHDALSDARACLEVARILLSGEI